MTEVSDDEGDHANVRRMVLDMIEEYGRHVGHADLIRESVDGLVGEDPPGERPLADVIRTEGPGPRSYDVPRAVRGRAAAAPG